MTIRGFENKDPLKYLSEYEIKRIHDASLEVLETCGINFEDEEARKVLSDSGCIVDNETGRVKIPAHLVEKTLKLCPGSFTQKSRVPDYDLRFELSNVFFANHSAPYFRDIDTGERKIPSLKEVGDLVLLLDALENIHAMPMPLDSKEHFGLGWNRYILRARMGIEGWNRSLYGWNRYFGAGIRILRGLLGLELGF